MPVRIQRQRSKGWRMPPGAVYVGRGSLWGNPFKVTTAPTPDCFGLASALSVVDVRSGAVVAFHCLTKREAHMIAVANYAALMRPGSEAMWRITCEVEPEFAARIAAIDLLWGRNLACWCPPDMPCHADVLLEIANGREPTVTGFPNTLPAGISQRTG
jgi:hypothetical protein